MAANFETEEAIVYATYCEFLKFWGNGSQASLNLHCYNGQAWVQLMSALDIQLLPTSPGMTTLTMDTVDMITITLAMVTVDPTSVNTRRRKEPGRENGTGLEQHSTEPPLPQLLQLKESQVILTNLLLLFQPLQPLLIPLSFL